jgi:hypothetical protein
MKTEMTVEATHDLKIQANLDRIKEIETNLQAQKLELDKLYSDRHVFSVLRQYAEMFGAALHWDSSVSNPVSGYWTVSQDGKSIVMHDGDLYQDVLFYMPVRYLLHDGEQQMRADLAVSVVEQDTIRACKNSRLHEQNLRHIAIRYADTDKYLYE